MNLVTNVDNSIWLIFLGSVLAFLSSAMVELLKQKKEWRRKKSNYTIYIRLELKALAGFLDKLKNNLEAKRFFDFLILNVLEQSLKNLELSKQEAYYLENYPLQEKLLNVLSDFTIFLNDLTGLERFSLNERDNLNKDLLEGDKKISKSSIFNNPKELEDFFTSRRTEKLIELIDIKRRIEDLIKEI